MKILNTFSPPFKPGTSGNGTLDFSQLAGFSINKLYAVINVTQNTPLYIPGAPGLGATSVVGSVVTLAANTSTYGSTDILNVYYDASNLPTELNITQESGGNLQRLLENQQHVLVELRVMNEILAQGFSITDDLQALRNDLLSADNIGSSLP
jgi:hypothetical protein